MARLCTSIAAALMIVLPAQVCRGEFDITGDWAVAVEGDVAFPAQFVQTGSSVTTSFGGSGTIDTLTGAFTLTVYFTPPACGAILEAQLDPAGATFIGTADVFTTPADCYSIMCVCTEVTTVEFLGSRLPCGNGAVDPGEECDDGNLGRDGECCSLACTLLPAESNCADDGNACTTDTCDAIATCTHSPGNAGTECRPAVGVCDVAEQCDGVSASCPTDVSQPDGTNCSDGAFCNGAETTCLGGVCQTSGPPCPLLCDEVTDQCLAQCPAEPRTCRSAEKSVLLIKKSDATTAATLVWKWIKGEPTSQVEFADPTASTDYALCIYAGVVAGTSYALGGETLISADGAKWSPISSKGYKYKDPEATGIRKVLLKGSDENKTKVLVKGSGVHLQNFGIPALAPISVQLVNGTNGLCWGVEFQPSQLIKNADGQLKAKAP